MSHETFLYPQSTGGLTLGNASCGQVREEGAEYRPFSSVLLEYVDLVNEKLPKAQAVAWLLRDEHTGPQGTIDEASVLIAELIEEVVQANEAMWAQYQRLREA
mgnify:CR=1 FL=1